MEYLLGLLFFRKILLMNRFADKSGDPRELLHCPQQDRNTRCLTAEPCGSALHETHHIDDLGICR